MNIFLMIFDYIVIGSGFGGSVAALRLVEKGYKVLLLEQGKRYNPEDFPRTNWNIPKYLWIPSLRCFGFQKLSFYSTAEYYMSTIPSRDDSPVSDISKQLKLLETVWKKKKSD